MIAKLIARVLEAPLAVHDVAVGRRDAIVVLGARLGTGDTLTPILDERIVTAAMLYRLHAAPRVVATGGVTGHARRAEATVLAEGLVAAGIPRDAIVIEAAAQTTADNARLTAALLAPLGAHTVWLVTQPFHGRRAARLFRSAGLDPAVWHIADSVQYRDRSRAVRWLVREYAAWAKHFVFRGDD